MTETAAASTSFSPEKTFKSYTREQGEAYAQSRRGYHPKLYETIVDYHTSHGGKLDTLLDVGCGPGISVREFAPRFAHAIGLDGSEGMIGTARSIGGATSTSESIRFEVSPAEELGSQVSPPIPDSSVDVITSATAAHWFNMSEFWPRAAKILKPGGTVALWTTSSRIFVHPSTPNHELIQASIYEHLERQLAPYVEPGNMLARNLYVDLKLPWTLEQTVPGFDQSTFVRREWNRSGANAADDEFLMSQYTLKLEALEKVLGTASWVTRWREAHPDAAGTESDVLRMMRTETERLLHEAGVEEGNEVITGGRAGVLLMLQKKA
ncbi:methyltransferase domain-containing protein [Rhizodiscina lignyota]|uniref:Methyltransferase domain-containing protein n=1 Tax=Rhizodiscina lignyota TaxID=1504668 RepID=A0A9P4I5H7_9PEZI|nr:methyltransferase domain-containing protein [Rhizodiscina lignyota]